MAKIKKSKKSFRASKEDFASLTSLQKHFMTTAISKGWYAKKKYDLGRDLVHLMEELGELIMAYRKGSLDKPCDKTEKMMKLDGETLTCQEEEVADLIIKTLCISSALKIDISKAVKKKDAYNQTRPFKHGKII